MNSASLRFIPKEDLEKEGHGQYAGLFEGKWNLRETAWQRLFGLRHAVSWNCFNVAFIRQVNLLSKLYIAGLACVFIIDIKQERMIWTLRNGWCLRRWYSWLWYLPWAESAGFNRTILSLFPASYV
jgi:hypothetical protein